LADMVAGARTRAEEMALGYGTSSPIARLAVRSASRG
jgi:hypothetical protein